MKWVANDSCGRQAQVVEMQRTCSTVFDLEWLTLNEVGALLTVQLSAIEGHMRCRVR